MSIPNLNEVLGTTSSEEESKTNPILNCEMKPDLPSLMALGNFGPEDLAAIQKACKLESEKEKKESINWPAKVTEGKSLILNQATKGILWTAGDVGNALVKIGSVGKAQGWNVLARALGQSGHGLPYRKLDSKRYFLLACIGATPEEKKAKQEQLNLLPSKAAVMLVARFETIVLEEVI